MGSRLDMCLLEEDLCQDLRRDRGKMRSIVLGLGGEAPEVEGDRVGVRDVLL